MEPMFFATLADWRKWLEKNHDREKELLVGFYKKESGKPSITWPESVDGALCFGWIDGVRRSIDASSYTIRFTPRRPRSFWSSVNIRRVNELIALGMMHPAGLRAFEARTGERSGVYSFEQKEIAFEKHQEQRVQERERSVALLSIPTSVVSPDRDMVGHQRQEGRDQSEAPEDADC